MKQINKKLIKKENLNLEDLKTFEDKNYYPEYIDAEDYIQEDVLNYFEETLKINSEEIQDLKLIYDLYGNDFYFYFKSEYIELKNFKNIDLEGFKQRIINKIKKYKPILTPEDIENINYILDDLKLYTRYTHQGCDDYINYYIDTDYISETVDINLEDAKTEELEKEIYTISEEFNEEIKEYISDLNTILYKRANIEYNNLELEEHKRYIFNEWKELNNIFKYYEFYDLNLYADSEDGFKIEDCLFIGATEYIKFYIDLKDLKNIKKHTYNTTYAEIEYKEEEFK
jgi:hypothetical protein